MKTQIVGQYNMASSTKRRQRKHLFRRTSSSSSMDPEKNTITGSDSARALTIKDGVCRR